MTERDTKKHRDKQTERQSERQTVRHTERQIGRQTEGQKMFTNVGSRGALVHKVDYDRYSPAPECVVPWRVNEASSKFISLGYTVVYSTVNMKVIAVERD